MHAVHGPRAGRAKREVSSWTQALVRAPVSPLQLVQPVEIARYSCAGSGPGIDVIVTQRSVEEPEPSRPPAVSQQASSTSEPTERSLPSAEGTTATASPAADAGIARTLQLIVSVCLVVGLGFLVASNTLGWTARAKVTKVAHHRVAVEGRAQAFQISESVRAAPGDAAAIRVKCTPRCQSELVGIWRVGEARATLVGSSGADPGPSNGFWVNLYGQVFWPALPIVATVQNTLTGLAQLAWIFVLAQIVFPAVRRRPKFLSYEMTLDLIYVLQTQLLYLTVAGTAVGISTGWLQAHTPVLFPALSTWPLWLQVVLALWVYDFVVYWRHRLEHQLSFLWPIHAVHHTTKKVDVFTTTRLHPLELMAGGILNMWVTARFGIGQEAASIGFMLYLNYNYYVHTNVKIVYPGFLKYLFVSPFMHRWHHANEAQACDKNFGVIFAWNDWLFGTAIHPKREPLAYGIDYDPGEVARDSYLAHLVYPFQVLGLRLFRRASSLLRRRHDALNQEVA